MKSTKAAADRAEQALAGRGMGYDYVASHDNISWRDVRTLIAAARELEGLKAQLDYEGMNGPFGLGPLVPKKRGKR